MTSIPEIEISISDKIVTDLYSILFQVGVLQRVQVGTSIRNLLCEQFSIDESYVDKRISIIFLNSQPVDNIGRVIIQNNDTLALSSAMPGLLGATLKRESHLAPLRKSITLTASKNDASRTDGIVTLKLFNLISQELGPALLRNGVLIKTEDIIHIFSYKQFPELMGQLTLYHGGKEIGMDDLSRILQPDLKQELVFLKSRL
jgi:hypothetical protein